MKYHLKISSGRAVGFSWIWKRPLLALGQVLKNVHTSYGLMTKKERIFMFALLLVGFSLLGVKLNNYYVGKTTLIPKAGGEYTEAMVGEVKYLNPILASNDAEKSVAKLLFSGLVKVTPDGNIAPDLAENFEISPDGKIYTFHMRQNAKFSDGTELTAQDIAFTIDAIKAPELKSPLNQSWLDVEIEVPDQSTVVMKLPNAYGPFIYNCTFGVLPAGLSSDDFAKKVVGSGPFAFEKLSKTDNKISEIKMKRNSSYYSNKPYIDNIILKIYDAKNEAEKAFESNKRISALFGGSSEAGKSLDFQSSKRLGLILNTRSEKLKDLAIRRQILSGEKLASPLKLGLTTLDSALQHSEAEALKEKLKDQNVEAEIFYFNAVKLREILDQKKYDLLLYGFDFGFDRDPYTFWHSSQLNQQNYAGWSDKDTDILLEDARMISDSKARNLKYDDFFNILKEQYVIQFFEPITYNFRIKEGVKGADVISGTQPFSRYDNIAKWYIKEKRVRK